MNSRQSKPYLVILFLTITSFPFVYGQQFIPSQIEAIRKQSASQINKISLLNPAKQKNYPTAGIDDPGDIQRLNQIYSLLQKNQSVNCIDSSFRKIFEAENRAYSFLCSARTRDGGILIGGYGTDQFQGPPFKWNALITKFDSAGNHIWSRELQSDVQTALYIESIKELSDGSIIVAGWHENVLSSAPPTPFLDFFMSKITATGSIIWFKTFHSLLGNGCSTSNIRFPSFAEGQNGDIYVAATIPNCAYPMYLVVFKINSAGILQWKYSFSPPDNDVNAIGIYYEGSSITVVNRSLESTSNSIFIHFLKLDASTGAYISHKGWSPNLPYPDRFYAGFTSWTVNSIRMINGNYCVFGPTFGDFISTTTDQPHFAVLEFNSNYDYVKGYTINSSVATNPSESRIKVDDSGKALCIMTSFTNWMNKTKLIASADNGTIINQRTRLYNNMEVFYDNFELFDDGSYVYICNMATPGQSNFYLEYSLLHNSDTGSICLGLKDNFSYTKPINYSSYNFFWGISNPNPFIETPNQNNNSVPIDYIASSPCFEKTFCDTIHITGNASSCNFIQNFTFTAHKNKECGSAINWIIDPSVVDVFQKTNDTTLILHFNQSWQGWLYGEIATSCGKIKDSLLITVSASPGAVQLGPDTSICTANTIILNAHKGYASYLWNNGSIDSLLAVSAPGKYFVDVIDACGNFFSDTVVVTAAPPIPFSIGADRTKCNADTIHLSAPSGFLNYTWGPLYNIDATATQTVVVQPFIDTSYFVKAEKTPGCFAYDTVRVKVNTSPTIALGTDKSFCLGDSAIFDAGIGFSQYQWSNGSISQKIVVKNTGNYFVEGITAEGCKSYDTIAVINIWPNPIVSLDDDPALCIGSNRVLQAGNFSSYLWQNGSTSSSLVVNNIGTYYVTVWDNNHCTGHDTAQISTLIPLPASFLPKDTSICNYGNLTLKSTNTFKNYLWNNNSSSESITITQPGIYWLQVTDMNDCIGKDSIVIRPKECLTGFYIPNAFTPNDNGHNDIFKPFIGGIVKQYQFSIYNRWGQIVFSTKDIQKGWDGTFAGIKQDPDVFIWMCTYQLDGNNVKTEKGTVVLIR